MSKTEEKMKKLQDLVKAGPGYLGKGFEFGMQYVTDSVVPQLKEVLEDSCREIEGRHRINENEDKKQNFVIHYTSIGALVSMLQNAVKGKQKVSKENREGRPVEAEGNATKDEQKFSRDGKTGSLRLYDSVHFNDPDEGNYLFRHLPPKHAWLGEKMESHAYIASFIIPNDTGNMSDNLVFWRTYGREGEGCSLKLCIPSGRLRKVLYDAREVKKTGKILLPALDSLHPLVSIGKPPLKKEVRKKLAEVVWESLEKIRYLYKSKAYEYEHECRFVTPELDTPKDRICFEDQDRNNSPLRIRHYYNDDVLKVENILTTGSLITLGPCVPYPYNMGYYIRSLLTKAGLAGPEIKLSEIPYRKP